MAASALRPPIFVEVVGEITSLANLVAQVHFCTSRPALRDAFTFEREILPLCVSAGPAPFSVKGGFPGNVCLRA